MSRGTISTDQYEDILSTLNPGMGDARLKKNPAEEVQKSTSRRFINFKDKVFATISGTNENSDSETNASLSVESHNSQRNIETISGSKTEKYEIGQPQQQKVHRATPKSVPIVLETDLQKELSSVMDDRPPVPAKNHARPQVQHKLDNKRERESRKQNTTGRDQRQDQMEDLIVKLQEELQKAKEQAFQAEEEVLRGREIQEGLRTQLLELISQHEGQYQDSDKLKQQNSLFSPEISRAHGHLSRDEAYQTLVSELKISGRNESILKSQIKLLNQDMATLKKEAKSVIQELKADATEARAELQRRVQESDAKVARAQEQQDQVISEGERVRKQLDRLVQQVASQTSLDVYHFDDTYFQSQFSALRGSIKDWAHRAFANGQFTSDRKPSLVVEKVLKSMSTHWESYVSSDEHRSTIMQAFTWAYLVEKVFGGVWKWSKAEQPFGQFLNKYHEQSENQLENLQLYHEWRSMGARLAVPQGTEQNALEGASTLLKDTADVLQNYLEPWSTLGKAQSNGMLLKIIKEAVQLDLKMQQQKASFFLWGEKELRKQKNGLYDPSAMEVRYGKVSDGRKDVYVQLLIAPLLVKRGTSDGRDYTVTVILEKAQVDIAVPPKKFKGLLNIVK